MIWKTAKNSRFFILLLVAFYLTGCVSIPAGKIWHEEGYPKTRIVDEDPVEATLNIIKSEDKGKLQVELEAVVQKKEVAEVGQWAEKSKRITVGLFPGKGHVIVSKPFE
ncbi:MAG: hypothetical protein KAS04_03030 [Candidatus Aenigmarchaeota archaeon]|nr:hypothetical protein [Candidatus Aenigmarchaeota archaeon]